MRPVILFCVFGLIAYSFSAFSESSYPLKKVKKQLNDSLSISISYSDSGSINTIILKNRNAKTSFIYGLHDDGVTPVLVGKEVQGEFDGRYLTYYSNGFLHGRWNFKNGLMEGWNESYSSEGVLNYRAFYEKGVEKEVAVGESANTKIDIAPVIKED